MRVLILGDTHAQDDIFLRILAAEKEYDAVLHTGDFEGSEFVYRELSDAPLYAIAGNNDFTAADSFYYDAEIIIMVHTREGKGCEDITLIAQ